MIEKMLPIEIPPGLVMNGSLMDKKGRWMDGNHIRFHEGHPQAVGAHTDISTTVNLGGAPQGCAIVALESDIAIFALVATADNILVAYLDASEVLQVEPVTPVGLTDQGNNHTWSFAVHGDTVAISKAGPLVTGSVYYWDGTNPLNPCTVADLNGPSLPRGVFTTPEKFLMCINAGKTIVWPDQSDITDWVPTSTNTAGSVDLPTRGIPYVGRAVGSETLVWTSEDLWELPYLNDDELYYGKQLKADACGIIGANALAVDGNVARWMGPNGFFQYDGFVSPIPCPLHDYIFGDIDIASGHQFFTISNPHFHEVQWWYVSGSSPFSFGPDRYVSYNYQNNTWGKGEMGEGGVNYSAGAFGWPPDLDYVHAAYTPVPIMFSSDGTALYKAEQPAGMVDAYVESGPIELGDGDRLMRVQKIIPDGAVSGDTITLFGGTFPDQAEALTTTGGGGLGPINVRMTARYVRYKQTFETAASRVGVPRLGVIESSRR